MDKETAMRRSRVIFFIIPTLVFGVAGFGGTAIPDAQAGSVLRRNSPPPSHLQPAARPNGYRPHSGTQRGYNLQYLQLQTQMQQQNKSQNAISNTMKQRSATQRRVIGNIR